MSAESKELERILKKNLITPVFQPIVNLQSGEIFAYEALSRGPQDSCLFRPDKLFTLAEKQNCLWRLDYLCRTQALLQAKNTLGDRKLFVNVDARVLYDKKFHQGSTAKLLKQCNLHSGSIVFEISEKSAITDYDSFRSVLENYQCQDYKIAIDDVGSGYSGLNLLAQVSPEFIKIDIGLIKNIDTDPIKKAIVKALADFSHTANIKTIAEGIERSEELKLLIELGINYGQGFYLGKPMPVLSVLSNNITEEISTIHLKKEEFRMNTRLNMSIGETPLF
jgi:EAL domain-containing protein (putative c-di-GMP-specific phosphodiesterase class I)